MLDSEKTLQRWMIIAFQQLNFLNWMNFIKRKEKSIMLKFDYFSFKKIGKTSIKLTKSNHLELLKYALREISWQHNLVCSFQVCTSCCFKNQKKDFPVLRTYITQVFEMFVNCFSDEKGNDVPLQICWT
jgi:hypothetical protein